MFVKTLLGKFLQTRHCDIRGFHTLVSVLSAGCCSCLDSSGAGGWWGGGGTTTTAPQSGLFFPHTYCSFFFQSTSLALLESQLQRSVSNAADYRTVCTISLAGEREPTLCTPRSDVAISGFLWHSAAGDLRRISATKKDRRVEAGQRVFPLPHSLCLHGVKHVTLPK